MKVSLQTAVAAAAGLMPASFKEYEMVAHFAAISDAPEEEIMTLGRAMAFTAAGRRLNALDVALAALANQAQACPSKEERARFLASLVGEYDISAIENTVSADEAFAILQEKSA